MTAPSTRRLPKGLEILHEDRDLLVVDKPAGLLTVATSKERSRTAYHALTDYVRKGASRSRKRIFIVHRLDRDTSGILVFAKSPEAKQSLQEQWHDFEKTYLAVVHGRCAEPSGKISSYLVENRARRVYSTTDARLGKLSHTAYRVLDERGHLSLIEVDLLTGRKHQIRVHFADLGHPVVGDRKYGREQDGHRRLGLHARSLAFAHPFDGRRVALATRVPAFFRKLFPGMEVEPGSS